MREIMDSATPATPVFIVGMNGSGTTMLLDNLGRHPELYAFPRETRLIPYLAATQARYGDLNEDANFRRLWEAVLAVPVFERVNKRRKLPLPDDWASYPRNLAAVIDGVFRRFAAPQGKHRWCEKSPQYVQHMATLLELYPGAKFVHVVRDGRDCAASFHRRWSRSPELTVYRWKKVVNEGRETGARMGAHRYMEVRYEHLTTDPEAWLKKICEFLSVPFDEAILESKQPYLQAGEPEEGGSQATGLVPNSGKWKRYFSASRIRKLEAIAGKTLASLGYETDDPDGDRDYSRLWLQWLFAKDATTEQLQDITRRLSGDRRRRPWKVILGRPLRALRQRAANRF